MSPDEKRSRAEETLATALGALPTASDSVAPRHWREMVENSVKSTVLLAPDGTILEANQRSLESLMATRDAAIGAALWDMPVWSMAEDRARVRTSIAAGARGVSTRHDMPGPSTNAPTTLDVTFTPIAGKDGTIALILGEWRDITDRKRTEAALRESEERFHRIVEIAADGIITIDDQQRITLFNKRAEKIFGYTEAEAIGQPLSMLLPPELADVHAREVRGFGDAPDVARRMGERRQIFGRRKSGEVFSAEASIAKATIAGRRVFSAVVRDVTERWAAEQEKAELLAATQKARDEAQAAARQRDEMLGIVSHDLRNPLSAIGMCASILADPATSGEEHQRMVETITESVQWTHRLISDLLDIASIEAGGLSVKAASVDPVIVIGRALALFEFPAANQRVTLRVLGDENLPRLLADGERLLQVLSNLIGNALKFTPEGGTISVSAEPRDGALVFSVRDTGSGIAPEHLPHVFDRRWHSSSSKSGTGLGLTIARGIVEAHGGRIWVASAPGSGSAFQFSIPLPAQPA